MSAGDYRTIYVRLVPIQSRGELGSLLVTYEGAEEYWGYLEELSAEERIAQGKLQQRLAGRVYLRGPAEVVAQDRLKDKATGAVYEIQGVTRPDRITTVCDVFRWGA